MPEELLEHRHYVLIGVIVVVPEHHVIPRLLLGTTVTFFGLGGSGSRDVLDGLHGGSGGHGRTDSSGFADPVNGPTETA